MVKPTVKDETIKQVRNYKSSRKQKRKLSDAQRGVPPPNKIPDEIKRKFINIKSAKVFDCRKCNFVTKYKAYLPTHEKLVHGKVLKKVDINNLTRTNSTDSNSSIKSPPNRTRKVKKQHKRKQG